MLKVIVGVRRSGKTTKMRELLAEYDGELNDLAVWCNKSIQHELGKFRDIVDKQVFTKDLLALHHKKEIFIDDTEFCEDLLPGLTRSACEGAINLTVAFSPMPIDLTWPHLPFWWIAWQRANEIIQTGNNWTEKDLAEMGQNIGDDALFRTQFKGDVLFKTRNGLMELKNVK